MKFKQLLLSLFMLANCTIYGQELITDRPDQTESSSTVVKGSLQIESGLYLGFGEDSEKEILAPTTLFRYGLTDGIELRVVNQYESLQFKSKKIEGISDLEIGAKVQLLQNENVNTEIAFLTHLIVPTGSKELTNDAFGSVNKLSISHGINENLGFGYNLGYNYFGEGKGDLTYSLVLGIGVTDKTGIYIEPYGEIVEFEESLLNMDAGFTYLLRDNFQLDFSFGTGINHTMNFIAVGFSWYIIPE